MSEFLPEGYGTGQSKTANQAPQSQSQSSDGLLNAILSDDKRVDALIDAMFGDPNRLFRIAPVFFSYMQSWIEQSGLQIPIGQVFGTSLVVASAGSIMAYAAGTAPSGWLLCDGTAVSRETYAGLFSVISTNYGIGDGSTTFNLPDLRGRVPVGKGTHANHDNLGDSDSMALNKRSTQHHHSYFSDGASMDLYSPGFSSGGINLPYWTSGTSGGSNDSFGGIFSVGDTSLNPGGPAYMTLNFIIKT